MDFISCPYCSADESTPWATENGYCAVQCSKCGFVYVNPRPSADAIAEAVETGIHTALGGHNVVGRRSSNKIQKYKKNLSKLYSDVWAKGDRITWLDIGSGFGEIIEAIQGLAPEGSQIVGVEPMTPKAVAAQNRGLKTVNGYLSDVKEKYRFASLVNVFSHIPDFKLFLSELDLKLEKDGEFLLVTGNAADVKASSLPSALDLPDHLNFAGISHLKGFLESSGYEVISIMEIRRDTIFSFFREIIKAIMGRDYNIVFPYTSNYRELFIRSRRNG